MFLVLGNAKPTLLQYVAPAIGWPLVTRRRPSTALAEVALLNHIADKWPAIVLRSKCTASSRMHHRRL